MALILLIVGVLFNVFLGILVALQRKEPAARALVLVSLGLIAWEAANYAADLAAAPLLWNRLTFIGPPIALIGSYYFVMRLRGAEVSKWQNNLIIFGTAIILLLCLTPAVVADVVPRTIAGNVQGYDPVRGLGYVAYLFWVGVLILLLIRGLFLSIKHAGAIQRAQMQLVRIGTFGAILVPVITSVVLPNISQSASSTKFVPIMSIVYMGALSVAILRHKMLDIQDFVVRAGVFSFTTIIIALIYVTPVVLMFAYLSGYSYAPYQIIIAVLAGTIVAVTYNRVHTTFVRITNKIFFRSTYDPTTLLSELNAAFLNTTDVEKLLASTARIINNRLSSTYCNFVLVGAEDVPSELLDKISKNVFKNQGVEIAKLLNEEMKGDVLQLEVIQGSNAYELLFKKDAAVVIRLHASEGDKKTQLGYMVIGVRKSGKPYNSEDARVLETAADGLSIAFQEALYFEKIKAFNASLQEKVSEATGKLRASNTKLKALDESKDEFISMASHQLRTPLTSIKGYISMVLDGDMGEITPQQRKVLEEAFASSQRMVYLIGDFLNVSRIQTGKFMLEKSSVQLANIIKDEIDQLRATAAARSITLSYDAPQDFPVLVLDENKIRQVMMNFIDNAIYYSPPETTITISIVKHRDDVTFRVQDQGIGVPKSEQHQLFSKFYRASNARKQRPDGTGIGLFMAKKVIVAHGGSIIFETQEGKGSTFGFTLPLAAVTSASVPAQPEATPAQV